MGFYEITKEMYNFAFTENGDKAYLSTGSYCLDYFSIIGGMRYNYQNSIKLFLQAFYENPKTAIKLLFFVRDIKEGLGERNIFRYTFNMLSNMYPDVCKQLIEYIPQYGRYDDLLCCYETPLRKDIVALIEKQLKQDIENKQNSKPISLLSKWLPSINTSNFEARSLASKLCQSLNMTKEEYRKTLSYLRKDLIIENNLRESDYTFDYAQIPGGAMLKYKNTFFRKDVERYHNYLKNVKSGKEKMNTQTLYPYQIIRRLQNYSISEEEKESLDVMWNNFDKTNISSKTIVVRDGSGSMYDNAPASAISVATSLAILFAEQLQGEFKNKFITFSHNPKLIEIKGNTISEKYEYISKFDDVSNTDIKKVYDLILKVYKHKEFKKEDALDRIVIISDMEFDEIEAYDKTSYLYFKEKFEKLGFEIPEVVFWNVRTRNIHFPVTNAANVKLVSGASQNIINKLVSNEGDDAYELMLECIKKYDFIDAIKI